MPTDYLYLQGPLTKALLQDTELSETSGEYSSQYKKNYFMLTAGQDYRTAIHQTYFIFVVFFSKTILTKQYILHLRIEKLSTVFSTAGFRFEEK